MANMLGKIQSGRINRPQKVVLYGVEKSGKSSLIAGAPGVLFLDTEQGSSHLDVARIEIRTWLELSQSIKELRKEAHEYKVVAVDTFDWAEKLGTDSLLEEEGKDSIEKVRDGFGKGYTMLAEKMQRLLAGLEGLTDRGISVVLIAHAQVKRFDAPEGMTAYDRYQMKLSKKVEPIVKEWADSILFLNFKTRIVETKTGAKKGVGSDRVIYTERCAAYDAGCRLEGIAKEILLPGREEPRELFRSIEPVFMLSPNGSWNGASVAPKRAKASAAVKTKPIEPELVLANPAHVSEPLAEIVAARQEPEATADPNPDDPEDAAEFFQPDPENQPAIMNLLDGSVTADDVLGFVRFRKIIAASALLFDVPDSFVERVRGNTAGFLTAVNRWKKGLA